VRSRKQFPLEALQPYLLKPPDPPVPLDGPAIFGNDHPLEIEVGCGKGAFLVDHALKHPERNFLGIEIDRGLHLYVATRLAKREMRHVRMVGGDVIRFLQDCIATGCVAAVHIYFPDPWWKRRHLKRRVFTAEFVRQCERVLQADGRLYLATDVEEYFHQIMKTVEGSSRLQPTEEVPPLEAETNFARKAKLQARDVWRITYQKVAT
jgi:tRNA (guanine-N7-)-methyltransferase